MITSAKEIFEDQGFLDPFQLLNHHECQQLIQDLRREMANPPVDWDKGYAISSRSFFEIGHHPVLIQLLRELIGKDILLWGASLVIKHAGAIHPWHCDIESSAIDAGKTVSV